VCEVESQAKRAGGVVGVGLRGGRESVCVCVCMISEGEGGSEGGGE
jgi:hypothetical protein